MGHQVGGSGKPGFVANTNPYTGTHSFTHNQLVFDEKTLGVDLPNPYSDSTKGWAAWAPGAFTMHDDPIVPVEEIQAKRKAAGECLHCGTLLPMSAMGLGDCKVCVG